MIEENIKKLIQEIKVITNNDFCIKEWQIYKKNNYLIKKMQSSVCFKRYMLDKIKRLYNTYNDDEYQKKYILENIKKLFLRNNWEGAYSELIAYDVLNLVFDEPCKIQIDNIKKEQTLARYFEEAEVSAIDGFLKDIFAFFEIKTLSIKFPTIFSKLKKELECYDEDNYFIIKSDYPMNLEFTNDKMYAKLKNEIIKAKEHKEKLLNSSVIKGLNLRFFYERKSFFGETHVSENPWQKAQRLERLPLENYKQFVDGRFVKIFVCNGLNTFNNISYSRDFFRALARRVFCRLTKVDERFDNNSKLTISFIAKHLSGLCFIVDLSANIENYTEDINNLYKIYFYKNPNADNEHSLFDIHHVYPYLNRINCQDCDDFEYDNY